MRPLRLELNGFTAYRDHQEVDFTDLDLFVITGPTGAGKTSLLDAITLSLYGRVARMGGTGLGELVSHGKPEARVMLEFSVDGDQYRVSRRLPRKGSQSGKLERADGDEWIDIVDRGGISPINKRLLELLKLDFDSFCKAIVLPQGEFARFLKGEPKERRETLTALLGLKVYERMGALARQRANELKIRGEQTRKILEEQFADATREALAAADESVEDATVQAERAGKLLARARELDRSRTHAALQREIAATLAGRLAAVSGELELEVEGCRAAEGVRERAEAARADAVNAAKAAGDAHAGAQSSLAETRSRTGTPENLGRMIDAVARREALEQRVAETQEKLDETTRTRQNLAAGVERHTAASTDATQAAEQALGADEAARSEAERSGADRDEAERRWTSGQEASAAAEAASGELSQAEALVAVAAQKAEAASHERSQAEEARAALHREHAAAALASGLAPGDPCPVCERPLVTLPPIEDEAARRLADAGAAYDRSRQSAQAAQDEFARANGGVSAAQARVADAKRRLESALDGLPDLETLEHQSARAREAADDAAAALAQATAARRAAEQTARDAALALTKAEAELAGAGREHDLRQQALDAAVKDRDETLALLRGRFGADVPADAGAQLEAMRADLDHAGHEEQAARTALDAAQEALRVADEAAGTAAARLTELDLRLGELRSRAESTLENLDRLDAQLALGEVPAPDATRDARASTLAEWCRTAATSLQDLSAALEIKSREAAAELVALAAALESAPTDAAAALEALEEAERLAVSSRVRADETRMRLAARVAQREELEAGLTDDDKQIAVLSVLARELRADHFIEFVLQETLDLLADHASGELLRISDDRYSLVSENGEFSVVDHVNADERRSVKTLSGGETFMAALSLALALSKHVTELAGEGLGARLDAVFIDEGFGSLDPETLDEVIDALERLREDDLLIGVISHVPALAERISAGLRVSKDGNRSLVLPRT